MELKVFTHKYEALTEYEATVLINFVEHYKIHQHNSLPVNLKVVKDILMNITNANWTTCLCNNGQVQQYSKVFYKLLTKIFEDLGQPKI